MTANPSYSSDVLIIGAGASGLMCAIEAGKRGRRVTVLEHANKSAKKILMSGGGRCNFTNYQIDASNFISDNPHFCKSALSRYSQWDFIALVEAYRIPYHERDLGKLFCNDSAKDIVNMLLAECAKFNVDIRLNCSVEQVNRHSDSGFTVSTSLGQFAAESLVVASGGLSIPKMCASPIGYQIAEHFGHAIRPTSAGLVPLTLQPEDKQRLMPLSGIAVTSHVSNRRNHFQENLLFTHRGLSGPAILQISSYWRPGEFIDIDLLPDFDLLAWLIQRQTSHANKKLKTLLSEYLPKRLVQALLGPETLEAPIQSLNRDRLQSLCRQLQQWRIKPNGTEGYRTAEVTLGGIDCNQLSSKTMESKRVSDLYFIGEVVDVTGWLGGYNFQWAWSSGWCAGQVV